MGRAVKAGALNGRVVILVDDGIATGATMQAAIAAVRDDHPVRVVVATPIAAPEALDRLSHYADEVICLSASPAFSAVGRHYESFPQLCDEDVRAILAAAVSRPAPLKSEP